MVNFVFGRKHAPDFIRWHGKEFDMDYKPEWLQTPMARKAIHDVERAEVLGDAIREEHGRVISPSCMSTGTKTLILIDHDPTRWYYGTALGNNCVRILFEIADEKGPINIMLEHYMDIPDDIFEAGKVYVDGKPCPNDFEFTEAYFDWTVEEGICTSE